MTTPDEAKRTALAYAWGCEDTSGTVTVAPAGSVSGDWAFSDAYAQGQDDYNSERRGDFLPVRDAYRNWQASDGRSVFPRGGLTLSDSQRRALRESWPDMTSRPEAFAAHYQLREAMQEQAWDALTPAS